MNASTVRAARPIREALEQPSSWWQTLTSSLDALAAQRTTRIATPDTQTITQELVPGAIERVFPR
ncbi:hypothetical protein [Allokutzneria oryzae]|uniref:Uncharacterized protein n=1 Tax=Allokutzneria oryzae TaxID=1378989 RepID=A0ABV5ZVB4_9PSEU